MKAQEKWLKQNKTRLWRKVRDQRKQLLRGESRGAPRLRGISFLFWLLVCVLSFQNYNSLRTPSELHPFIVRITVIAAAAVAALNLTFAAAAAAVSRHQRLERLRLDRLARGGDATQRQRNINGNIAWPLFEALISKLWQTLLLFFLRHRLDRFAATATATNLARWLYRRPSLPPLCAPPCGGLPQRLLRLRWRHALSGAAHLAAGEWGQGRICGGRVEKSTDSTHPLRLCHCCCRLYRCCCCCCCCCCCWRGRIARGKGRRGRRR